MCIDQFFEIALKITVMSLPRKKHAKKGRWFPSFEVPVKMPYKEHSQYYETITNDIYEMIEEYEIPTKNENENMIAGLLAIVDILKTKF